MCLSTAKCMASCLRLPRKQDRALASQKLMWLFHLACLLKLTLQLYAIIRNLYIWSWFLMVVFQEMPFVESPRLSGDIVMANKWFRECKAGSWEPWTLKGMMFDASMGFLIGLPAHGCAYVFTYKYSNVCWVAILCHSIQRKWFEHVQHVQFQAAGIKDDAVHFACMVEAHAKAAVCSTSHFPPASTADKGSSSRLSCHVVLEKLKLNLKTLQRCLSLLPVTLRTTLHAFSTMKNSKILLDAAPDWKILGKAGELEEAQKWLQRTWGWHGLTWHSVDLAL